MRVAGIVLEPREVVEDLDAQRASSSPSASSSAVRYRSRAASKAPVRTSTWPKAEDVVGVHTLGHGVVEQFDRRHGVLPCAGHVTDEVEKHRQQPVAARHEVAVPALRRPLVDLPDQLAARGVLALAAEYVGLNQLRALLTASSSRARARRSSATAGA